MNKAEITRRFDYQRGSTAQQEDCAALRKRAKTLANFIAKTAPEGREQALAMTHLEQTLSWAIAAIVRPNTGE